MATTSTQTTSTQIISAQTRSTQATGPSSSQQKETAPVMMTLGSFSFYINTVTYQELVRKWQWKWRSQSTSGGGYDVLQYTGKANPKISLKGQVATTLNHVGTQQLQTLAGIADKGKPLLLTSGLGGVHGYWVITDLSETNTRFVQGGLPQLQSFSLELLYYGDKQYYGNK